MILVTVRPQRMFCAWLPVDWKSAAIIGPVLWFLALSHPCHMLHAVCYLEPARNGRAISMQYEHASW
jgi:hypothetical protein